MLRNRNRIRFRRRAGAGGDESPSLHDPIQRAPIDHQVLDDWKGSDAKGLDRDCCSVAKFSHIKFTDRTGMIGTMCFAVNSERTGSADAFTAIGIKRDWYLDASEQMFVEDIEHFEERRMRRYVTHFVIDQFAG